MSNSAGTEEALLRYVAEVLPGRIQELSNLLDQPDVFSMRPHVIRRRANGIAIELAGYQTVADTLYARAFADAVAEPTTPSGRHGRALARASSARLEQAVTLVRESLFACRSIAATAQTAATALVPPLAR